VSYQQPTGEQPQPPVKPPRPQVPPINLPPIPITFPDVNDMPLEQLNRLLTDDVAFSIHLGTMTQVKVYIKTLKVFQVIHFILVWVLRLCSVLCFW